MSGNFLDASSIQGGFQYSGTKIFLGREGGQINNGLNFDLPLAAVGSFQNSALQYMSANAQKAFGFLDTVTERQQGSIDAATSAANEGLNASISRSFELATSTYQQTLSVMDRMHELQQTNLRYATKRTTRKGCFITTAVCKTDGLPDDCETLKIFRAFRDNVLAHSEEGRAAVEHYYDVAPTIVEKIDAREDAEKIYSDLRDYFLMPIKAKLEKNDFRDAFIQYQLMVVFAEMVVSDGR